jgi:hypothetical protein
VGAAPASLTMIKIYLSVTQALIGVIYAVMEQKKGLQSERKYLNQTLY